MIITEESVDLGPVGLLDVHAWKNDSTVSLILEGHVDVRINIKAEQARVLAAQLIAAADHAEGK